ncbi:ATP-binding protein [Mesorhizobium sp. GbtcB19]|uniref:ATP-binding protein n=1 Tax=Mesorhizobium sp. GbtcB19 TaxID=2824764 RepID=UPI001C2F4C38|nr:ATP-binding protein [Mesorhizobium sp. GbtcB19]
MNRLSINDVVTSKRAWIASIVLIAVLSASLGWLLWIMQQPNQSLPDFRDHFATLRNMEAKWDTEILSLQLGIAPNYDGVTNAARDLKLKLAETEHIAALDGLAALRPDVKSYREAIEQKDWLSEQVKASYAMLRNSATVLPRAISDSFRHPEILAPIEGLDKRPADFMTETITGMMSFTISPTALLRDTVQERISASRAAAQKLSPELADAIERFLVQIEVVTKERQRGNQLMLAVTSVPTGAAADRIQAGLQSLEEANAERQRALWDLALLLGALLALAFAAFAFVQWRRSAKLAEDNRMLLQVNEDAEEQLVQSAKLSALGQMVAGITHEINTPLAYVKAVFELIKERVLASSEMTALSGNEEDEARREELQMLLDDGLHGLEEMATLVRTMKNFSRLDKGNIESFSVEEGIESALLIARPQIKYVADVNCEFDSVPPIMGSASQLRQVLLNLIVNAAQAMATMDRRGLLTLRTRLTSSDTVQIDVCDNGPGIPEEHLGKLFDPFFTTKPVGEGSGMGLSICYRIIENHGGTITVNSKIGKGSIFTLTLPRQDEKFLQAGVVPGISDAKTKSHKSSEFA